MIELRYKHSHVVYQGGVAPKGQNPFFSNIIMLHIKSKVMKSRIQ